MPTPEGVEMKPFALKHDEADPARITAFELDHIIEVNQSCMRWGEARKGMSTDSPWGSGFTAMEAETLMRNLFAPLSPHQLTAGAAGLVAVNSEAPTAIIGLKYLLARGKRSTGRSTGCSPVSAPSARQTGLRISGNSQATYASVAFDA